MNAGDPIWYLHTPRGGYGFASDVPGEFVKTNAKTVTVKLIKKDGTRMCQQNT